MLHHPEAQNKLREEVMRVVGRLHPCMYSDLFHNGHYFRKHSVHH